MRIAWEFARVYPHHPPGDRLPQVKAAERRAKDALERADRDKAVQERIARERAARAVEKEAKHCKSWATQQEAAEKKWRE